MLFIVTDGLNDEGSPRSYPPMDWDASRCNAIKAKGIRIAVLYTQYISGSGGSWNTSAVAARPAQWAPSGVAVVHAEHGVTRWRWPRQQCASPGLYHEVSTDGDDTAALNTLFEEAIATARLLH